MRMFRYAGKILGCVVILSYKLLFIRMVVDFGCPTDTL